MSQKQVYRKKGESSTQEETKEPLQQTKSEEIPSRGGRGGHRGNRGGYQGRGGLKPHTSYGDRKPYY